MNSVRPGDPASRWPRVIIVGDNASLKMGGEPSCPLLFFKLLRERGVEAWLVSHARSRDELRELFPDDFDRIHLVEEFGLDVMLWKLGQKLPRKIDEQTIGMLRHVLTHRRFRRLIRGIVAREGAEVVHETMPISPKAPSSLYDLGVPVISGPLSGAMDYPPAFQHLQSASARLVERGGRVLAHLANWLVPGRIRADVLVVANDQTLEALPSGFKGRVQHGINEISVDVKAWKQGGRAGREPDGIVRFSYLGRLVDWKAVDLLIEAFRIVADHSAEARLEILGDGDDRPALEAQAKALGLADRIDFAGWVSSDEAAGRLRNSDVFVLPSLRECGGIVLLEAMAVGLPIVATRWGGPAVHVDDSTGILVAPETRPGFIQGLADAMIRLAESPELRRSMGDAAIHRVESGTYNWDRKIDRFLEIYAETIAGRRSEPAQRATVESAP